MKGIIEELKKVQKFKWKYFRYREQLKYLQDCRDLWVFMKVTGSDDKGSYLPSAKYHKNCPCCSYGIQEQRKAGKDRCDYCLLKGFAWNDYCFISGYYEDWRHSTTRMMRKEYATFMVQACDRAINYLEKNGPWL